MNKLFTIRAAGDEQKMQIRLWFVLLISMAFTLGTIFLFLQIVGENIASLSKKQFIMFIPIVSAIINIAPMVIKISWGKIIIQTAVVSIFTTLIFLLMFRIIS